MANSEILDWQPLPYLQLRQAYQLEPSAPNYALDWAHPKAFAMDAGQVRSSTLYTSIVSVFYSVRDDRYLDKVVKFAQHLGMQHGFTVIQVTGKGDKPMPYFYAFRRSAYNRDHADGIREVEGYEEMFKFLNYIVELPLNMQQHGIYGGASFDMASLNDYGAEGLRQSYGCIGLGTNKAARLMSYALSQQEEHHSFLAVDDKIYRMLPPTGQQWFSPEPTRISVKNIDQPIPVYGWDLNHLRVYSPTAKEITWQQQSQ